MAGGAMAAAAALKIGSAIGAGVGEVNANEAELQRKRDLEADVAALDANLIPLRENLTAGFDQGGIYRRLLEGAGVQKASQEAYNADYAARSAGSRTSTGAQMAQRTGQFGGLTGNANAGTGAGRASDRALSNMHLARLGFSDYLTKPLPENKLAGVAGAASGISNSISAYNQAGAFDTPEIKQTSNIDSDGNLVTTGEG